MNDNASEANIPKRTCRRRTWLLSLLAILLVVGGQLCLTRIDRLQPAETARPRVASGDAVDRGPGVPVRDGPGTAATPPSRRAKPDEADEADEVDDETEEDNEN